MNYLNEITIIIFSYLIGSVPFGLIVANIFGKGDIRKQGSGNIGATNVLRTSGKALGALTLLLDALKGAVAVIVAKKFSGIDGVIALSGFLAVIGHIFPIWLKFKGGKGVATAIAVYLSLGVWFGLFACFSWIVTFYFTRISSISSIATVICSFVIAIIFMGLHVYLLSLALAIIITLKHKSNILRLFTGSENQL